MSEELKPCDCGSTDIAIRYEGTQRYWIECGDCGRKTEEESRRSLAIHDWNTRAEPSAIKGGGEAVAYVSTHDLRCFIDGKYKAMTATLYDFAHPLHQPLYAHQPVVAEAEPVGSKVGAIEGGVVPGWRVTGRGGYSLCVQYPEWAEGCDDLKIEQLFAAPPASGAVPVPYGFIGELHEYLDNCAQFDPAYPPETQPDNRAAALLLNLRALLAKGVL